MDKQCQYAVGVGGIGHDEYSFGTSSSWPYDPIRKTRRHHFGICNIVPGPGRRKSLQQSSGLNGEAMGTKHVWIGPRVGGRITGARRCCFSASPVPRACRRRSRVGRLCSVPPTRVKAVRVEGGRRRPLRWSRSMMSRDALTEHRARRTCSLQHLPNLRLRPASLFVLDLWQLVTYQNGI